MRTLILFLLIPMVLWAQEFEFRLEFDSIPVEVDNYDIPVPWTGGYSESAPGFADIDADGDFDLFVGDRHGYIDYYTNQGSLAFPLFILEEENYQQISVAGYDYGGRSAPVFADIDADGDLDCFTSCFRGLVHYWENQGTPQNAQFVWITDSLENIDVPGRAHLDLTDFDADGDYDLFFG